MFTQKLHEQRLSVSGQATPETLILAPGAYQRVRFDDIANCEWVSQIIISSLSRTSCLHNSSSLLRDEGVLSVPHESMYEDTNIHPYSQPKAASLMRWLEAASCM